MRSAEANISISVLISFLNPMVATPLSFFLISFSLSKANLLILLI